MQQTSEEVFQCEMKFSRRIVYVFILGIRQILIAILLPTIKQHYHQLQKRKTIFLPHFQKRTVQCWLMKYKIWLHRCMAYFYRIISLRRFLIFLIPNTCLIRSTKTTTSWEVIWFNLRSYISTSVYRYVIPEL